MKIIAKISMNLFFALALSVTAAATGGEAPSVKFDHIEATKKVSLELTGLNSEARLQVKDNRGVLLLDERLEGQSSFDRTLDLAQLPAGRYLLVVATPLRDILQPVDISEEGLVLNPARRQTYFAPAVRQQDDQLDVTLLNSRISNVSITLSDYNGETVYFEKLNNIVQVRKRYDLKNLRPGVYTLEVMTPYKAYYKDVVVK